MASGHAAAMRLVAPVLLAMLVATGCVGNIGPGTIWVRNETRQSITVTVGQPGAFLPGIVGPAAYHHVVPPWQPGWCAGDTIDVALGSQATITVPGATTWRSQVMRTADLGTPTYLLVQADGQIVVVPPPQYTTLCQEYPEGTPPFPSPPG